MATKQSRIKFYGQQSVFSNARENLQKTDQGRRQTAFAYPDRLGRIG